MSGPGRARAGPDLGVLLRLDHPIEDGEQVVAGRRDLQRERRWSGDRVPPFCLCIVLRRFSAGTIAESTRSGWRVADAPVVEFSASSVQRNDAPNGKFHVTRAQI
jgi:hypothetical protein